MTILNRIKLYSSHHNSINNSYETLFKPFKSFHQRFHFFKSTTISFPNNNNKCHNFNNNNFNKRTLNTVTRHSNITKNNNNNYKNKTNASEIIKRKKVKEWSELSAGEKVIGAAKVTSNFSIIVIGIGIFGIVSYFVITELFGPSSSTKVFSESLDKIRNNDECQKVLGLPMTGQGIPHQGSRLRARRVYFQDVKNVDGTDHRLLQFHVQGSISHGKALLDMVKDDNGKWCIKYLIVTIPNYGKRIFVEYNSNNNNNNSTSIDNNDNKDNKK
ncbi:hypothetical protein Glove_1g27 [Diversispora epigaea]|uniref:Mitochondrial import inner membrane translocase subunit Tim21 n=1 Tax=Diversispora epigaea TaxID=1348612 RepID=A0A397JYE4_9GLOM|nr:hypothetical protein Glove_1g27 [Diversispora epigaea]